MLACSRKDRASACSCGTVVLIFKSKGVFMAVRIERMTLHSSSYQGFFLFLFEFFNWPDSCSNNVRSKKVKILPPPSQRVNLSHSSFFQKDLSVFNFSPHNMMFYDVIRRQCDRSFVLCKGKNSYKNTRYVFYVPFLSHRSLQLLLSCKTQKMRSKCSKGMIFQRWSYYGNRIRTCKKCETLTASFEL